jgi:predicted nuclease with TOPRIM domain
MKPTGSPLVPNALQPPNPLSPELVESLRLAAEAEARKLAEWKATAQSVTDALNADAAARKAVAAADLGIAAEVIAQRRRVAEQLREQLRG